MYVSNGTATGPTYSFFKEEDDEEEDADWSRGPGHRDWRGRRMGARPRPWGHVEADDQQARGGPRGRDPGHAAAAGADRAVARQHHQRAAGPAPGRRPEPSPAADADAH